MEDFSDSLSAIDLDGDVLESGLELFLLVVALLLAIDSEFEVEVFDGSISIVALLVLAIDINVDVLLGAIVNDSEGDPFALHAANEGLTASVPSHCAILIVKHGRGGTAALAAFMLDLEEGEGSVG